jgi:hypothetical protein
MAKHGMEEAASINPLYQVQTGEPFVVNTGFEATNRTQRVT